MIVILWILLAICVGLMIWGICVGIYGDHKPDVPEGIVTQVDTLVVRDTITQIKPIPRIVRVHDTIRVAVCDTVHHHDTVFMLLQREERVYEDSTYRAVVSGFRPSLDTMEVYPVTHYISTVKTVRVPQAKRWGIGLQAGYGVGLHENRLTPMPYVGVGVSWNIVSF